MSDSSQLLLEQSIPYCSWELESHSNSGEVLLGGVTYWVRTITQMPLDQEKAQIQTAHHSSRV